jgi:carbamoyl-phosphate synthase large subunit
LAEFLPSAKLLKEMGFGIMATERTAKFLNENGVGAKNLMWPGAGAVDNVETTLKSGVVDLVINLPNSEVRLLKL